VDFFAPVVDDPYEYGQVAAANALSDVYAMGGVPLTALGIVAFPIDALPIEVLTTILRGGQDKVHEAGATVIGGHSIIDQELKYGLAVTGQVHPARVLTNAAARPGDRLVLTKPLGTGFVTTALKRGLLTSEQGRPAIDAMRSLNRDASAAAVSLGIRCATDVTGFGALGHASHIARASNVTLRLEVAGLPVLPGAQDAWREGATPAGAERNEAYFGPLVEWGTAEPFARALVLDPQTSGGLLLSVPGALVDEYVSRVPGAVVIGDVVERGDHQLVLV
jgi:selenide,water dikinase